MKHIRPALAGIFVLCSFLVPAHAEMLDVMLDQARIVRLPDRVATIVIGNPAVADGTLQAGGLLIVTGRGYGTTNVIALGPRGETLAEHKILVTSPTDGLTVWRGVDRETWNCAPRCERAAMLGDGAGFFNGVVAQSSARNGHATGQPAAAEK